MKKKRSTTKKFEGDDAPPLATSTPSLWKVFKLAMPEMPMLLISFILMIGSEATNMITPLIVANAYVSFYNVYYILRG